MFQNYFSKLQNCHKQNKAVLNRPMYRQTVLKSTKQKNRSQFSWIFQWNSDNYLQYSSKAQNFAILCFLICSNWNLTHSKQKWEYVRWEKRQNFGYFQKKACFFLRISLKNKQNTQQKPRKTFLSKKFWLLHRQWNLERDSIPLCKKQCRNYAGFSCLRNLQLPVFGFFEAL